MWLFGENLGSTANNNSFYFWKEVVLKDDGIDKYIVLERNKNNLKVYKSLDKAEKKFVVWKNSPKHYRLYLGADMYFVTLSYKDITPSKFLFFNLSLYINKPLIYLQHGTLGIKKIGYVGNGYNNCMFRFIYYNKNIKDILVKENNFKPYQLHYGVYPPRYKELAIRHTKYHENDTQGKKILWFLTWREYFGDNPETKEFLQDLKAVLQDDRLLRYLEQTNSTLTLCLHQFFDGNGLDELKMGISDRINLALASKTDVLDELAKNDVLITDYSSVGFDFTFLNKPVILYQPDREKYLMGREIYCTLEELENASASDRDELINLITEEKYTVNPFFADKMPSVRSLDDAINGKHIEDMYNGFSTIQKNKVTFIGYNFYGIGGTVFATRALAEGLLEKNYAVELISLKCTGLPKDMPFGLQLSSLYSRLALRIVNKIKRVLRRLLHRSSSAASAPAAPSSAMVPVTDLKGYAISAYKRCLKRIKCKTVVSTREVLHPLVYKSKAPNVKHKAYFFHCTSKLVDSLFPGVMDKIKKVELDKAVFVTEENRQGYENDLSYSNYKEYLVIGNTLESGRLIRRDEIADIKPKDDFKGLYLVRLSEERKADIDNLIGFGEFLKEKNVEGVTINVFGRGEYANTFVNDLQDRGLEKYIVYCGATENPKEQMAEHDAVVDFTLNHSFGMPYIEAVLNGKMLFCTDNFAAHEVLGDIKGCIYTDYEDLLSKIQNMGTVTKQQLENNYDEISKRYSREALAESFIGFVAKD